MADQNRRRPDQDASVYRDRGRAVFDLPACHVDAATFSPIHSIMRPTAMRNGKLLSAIILLSFIQLNVAQTVRPARVEVEKRVDSILRKMTQEEKIEIIGGINDFYTRPIPRLGIRSLRMSDG